MLNKLKNTVLDSQIKKSIFRVGIPNTDRKRVLIVLGNVFLHLHPTKVRTSGVKLRYTWCAGGLSFLNYLGARGSACLAPGSLMLFAARLENRLPGARHTAPILSGSPV